MASAAPCFSEARQHRWRSCQRCRHQPRPAMSRYARCMNANHCSGNWLAGSRVGTLGCSLVQPCCCLHSTLLRRLSPQSSAPGYHTRSQLSLCAAAIPLAAITAQQALQPAAAISASHWPATIASGGIFLVSCAAAALLLSAIPLLWQLARTANRMESMLQVHAASTLLALLAGTSSTVSASNHAVSYKYVRLVSCVQDVRSCSMA